MQTMFDSVTLDAIPHDATAVAGYVNGRWPTFREVQRRWPHAHRLSIAVTAHAQAECLDVEQGDATNGQAPAWVKRQLARGVKRPVVYTSVSNAPALLQALAAGGIARRQVRLWTAHYTEHAHLCSPSCGFGLATVADATQYTSHALGRNLDASVVDPGFFVAGVPAAVRRRALRAWIMAQHRAGWSWARLKRTAQWKTWRDLGGR